MYYFFPIGGTLLMYELSASNFGTRFVLCKWKVKWVFYMSVAKYGVPMENEGENFSEWKNHIMIRLQTISILQNDCSENIV